MTTAPNPYAADLGGRDPIDALGDTAGRIRTAVSGWTPAQFERSYAPGKWSVRRILIHLAQSELALGTRARFALTQQPYTAQPFSQDDWLPLDEHIDGAAALDVYTTLRRMNLAMFSNLPEAALDREFEHPEYGTLTVRWILQQMAGHDIHHLAQIESLSTT
jgi:uncharacterized damage-inducible protein DinB